MSNYHFSVGLSQKPDDIRFGYTNQKVYLYSQSRDRSIINGINLFISLTNKFTQAYNDTKFEDINFINQKDLFISIALGKVIRCCQCVDSLYEKLTPHSELYWKTPFAYRNVWGEVPISYLQTNSFDRPDGYYGPAGSLAFYLYKYNVDTNSLSPIEILERALENFWSELSISSFILPSQQHQLALNRVGLLAVPFDLYTTALNYIWKNPDFNATTLNIVRDLRADAVVIEDFDSIKQKLMFATVKPSVLKALSGLQSFINNYQEPLSLPKELNLANIDPNTFKNILDNILDICKPAGFALIYQALAIQSLVRASRLIINTDLTLIESSYYEAIKYGRNTTLLQGLANNLSTGYDAYAALAYLETQQEARGYSYFIYQKIAELINYDVGLNISFDGNPYRLQGFK